MNDTRVIAARLFGNKESGGKVEIMIERILENGRFLAQLRASKSPKPDSMIVLEHDYSLKVIGREDAFFLLEATNEEILDQIIRTCGHIPLPPYINRSDEQFDEDRYQTVYARQEGAVAAPTAGLHFTDELLDEIHQAGVDTAWITLHVGAGTFQPVRVDDITDHTMHDEQFFITQEVCDKIKTTKAKGGRVIAVGTTTVRALESAAQKGPLIAQQNETGIFIYPGYKFKLVDAMVTNFHLPESTLLMLVSAFAGTDHILNAYHHAIEEHYRFFSYGDAMFISKR
jgi:S-adenosylmethionine:tRNA ribosyltransferase-isomerase